MQTLTLIARELSLQERPALITGTSTGIKLGGSNDWSVKTTRLEGGLSTGVDVVIVTIGTFSVTLLPTRGMGVWNASSNGTNWGWKSPVSGPIHPAFVNMQSRNGLGWLDGFDELVARCGLSFNGPPGNDAGACSPIESDVTLHGRIANLPAHEVRVTIDDQGPGSISVTGVVDERTLFGPQLQLTSTVTLVAGQHKFSIDDSIQNLSSAATELELLYHANFGPPFLEGGGKFLVASQEVVPRNERAAEGIDTYDTYLPPTPGYAEQVYFIDPLANEQGVVTTLLHNATADRGVTVEFKKSSLPCLSVWKCTQSMEEGYVTGIEPGTNYPNFKSYEREQGRVIRLAGGESYRCGISIEAHLSASAVSQVAENIRKSQSSPATVHPQPQPRYSV
ncbi:MAG: aldose 1-epimerase family protein [Planctomycetaceae bacterium]